MICAILRLRLCDAKRYVSEKNSRMMMVLKESMSKKDEIDKPLT